MSACLSIQPILPSVLPAVLELDNLCFGKLWTLEAYQREIDSPNSELLGLFLEKNQDNQDEEAGEQVGNYQLPTTNYQLPTTNYQLLAMGCFWAILDEAHITLLAVHPDYQGRGLGQALLWGLMQAARDRALERATLEVRESNQPAISLYSKFGFQLAGRRRRYYKDTNEDALILWQSGLQQPEFQAKLTGWHDLASDRLQQSGFSLNVQKLEMTRPESRNLS
ncbi:ribosomal protein S18-alanine N-acetyltransferase [Chroococcidiopsis thermalis]|uniref:(SSU ribosomal protein S18P)-alanine acetyltransferase n=1 Tax=Chroococcidiopsis thermalis (strain PCC 7203) TaxID=251229 RepID=K9U8T4_CHRTP|nr:ribosomal protein S18-alanine N-acetyltransferase [Chroococcidiopsis thermalis]AFY90831.1 (SSU ribosomal protein S18P)-alanine acetyltransferase [Chroococcidiopsis thermalis PCC 7203]